MVIRTPHVGVPQFDVIEHRERVLHERGLGWPSTAAAIAAVVHEIERVFGKRGDERLDVPGHVIGIAAEVEEGAWPGSLHGPHLEPFTRTLDPEHLCDSAPCLRRRKVDLRALRGVQPATAGDDHGRDSSEQQHHDPQEPLHDRR